MGADDNAHTCALAYFLRGERLRPRLADLFEIGVEGAEELERLGDTRHGGGGGADEGAEGLERRLVEVRRRLLEQDKREEEGEGRGGCLSAHARSDDDTGRRQWRATGLGVRIDDTRPRIG